MKIAVAGGTGTVGARTVEALRAAGHEPVVLTRSRGVDLVIGAGLDAALTGADAVIDTANITTLKADEATRFFTTATGNLVQAAARTGVSHVVLLSIVGIDRIPHDYYAGKLAQEAVVEASDVPWTILRATQFHEYAAMLFHRARAGARVAPRGRVQPIAVGEVAAHLVDLVEQAPQGRTTDLGGPREESLDDMVRRYAHAIGYRAPLPTVNVPGTRGRALRSGALLPGPEALRGEQTFTDWLDALPDA